MKKISRVASKIQTAIKRTLSPNLGYGTLVAHSEVEDERFGY